VEVGGPDLRRVPAVPPAQAPTPGLCQLRDLRRPPGHRGRVAAGPPKVSLQDSRLEQALGIRFERPALRDAALSHRSFAFERSLPVTNERLEFLGDAVLGLVITDLVYRAFPDRQEGELAKLRAAMVNMSTLADVARQLDLGTELLLGRGEELSGGRDKASILADALEAVFGAIYMDRGLDVAAQVITRLFAPRVDAYVRGEGERDYKTILQELAAQDLGRLPEYRVVERGPDHEKEFTATVSLGGRQLGQGVGRSKKEAEQRAARQAYDRLAQETPEMAAGEK
jgi:ribonuclease III